MTSHLATKTAGVLRTQNLPITFEWAMSLQGTVEMIDEWTARSTTVQRRPTQTTLLTQLNTHTHTHTTYQMAMW